MYTKRKYVVTRQMNNDALYLSKKPRLLFFLLEIMKIKLSLKKCSLKIDMLKMIRSAL